jgi:hypothetical protein
MAVTSLRIETAEVVAPSPFALTSAVEDGSDLARVDGFLSIVADLWATRKFRLADTDCACEVLFSSIEPAGQGRHRRPLSLG